MRMHAPFAQALVRILQAPHCAGASVERLQLIMTARSQSALTCAPRSPPLRSRDSPRSPPLCSRDAFKLTLGDIEWSGCESNNKLMQLPTRFYGEKAACFEQTHLGLDAARTSFVMMSRRHQLERAQAGVDLYWSYVPSDGEVKYERSVGYYISRRLPHFDKEATVFAYLYEPTVVHAFGRCDCRSSNDNCNHN